MHTQQSSIKFKNSKGLLPTLLRTTLKNLCLKAEINTVLKEESGKAF